MAINIIETKRTVVTADTLEAVREQVLAIAREASPQNPLHADVVMGNGIYRPASPIVFSTEENPELANISLTIRAKENTSPIVANLREVKGTELTPVPGKPYYKYQYEKDENGNYPLFHDFFCDGGRMKMAKSPVWHNPFALLPEERSGEKGLEGLYAPMDIARSIKENGIGATELRMYVQWEHYILRVKDVDLAVTKEVDGETYALVTFFEEFDEFFVKGVHRANNIGNRETFFTNNLAYLTEPGTFVYDWYTGTVYVVPNAGKAMQGMNFGYAPLKNYFVFSGMKNVTVEGLRFQGLTSTKVCESSYFAKLSNREAQMGRLREAAILTSNVRDFKVSNCTFRYLGANAVQMCDSSVRVTVENCRFTDIAMSGICVGNPDRVWSNPLNRKYNVKIKGNTLENIAYDYPNAAAIYLGICDGAEVSHNTIDGCGYSGILAGYGWCQVHYEPGEYCNLREVDISYNDIHNFMDICRDGAAIYVTGANATVNFAERFNYIHHNYAHLDQGGNSFRRGYYLDGSSSNFAVYDNVIDNCLLPLFTQYHVAAQCTHHNTVTNFYSTTPVDPANQNLGNDMVCDGIFCESTLEALFEKYPEAKTIADGAGAMPKTV